MCLQRHTTPCISMDTVSMLLDGDLGISMEIRTLCAIIWWILPFRIPSLFLRMVGLQSDSRHPTLVCSKHSCPLLKKKTLETANLHTNEIFFLNITIKLGVMLVYFLCCRSVVHALPCRTSSDLGHGNCVHSEKW